MREKATESPRSGSGMTGGTQHRIVVLPDVDARSAVGGFGLVLPVGAVAASESAPSRTAPAGSRSTAATLYVSAPLAGGLVSWHEVSLSGVEVPAAGHTCV